MDRRRFLQGLAASTASGLGVPTTTEFAAANQNLFREPPTGKGEIDVRGHTLMCEFNLNATAWMVYEDLRTRDGAITFLSERTARTLAKSAEASFPEANPPYLGLSLKDICSTRRDLLADRLLANGDPDPEIVKSAVPPAGSTTGDNRPYRRYQWDTFVGTKEAFDTMPLFPPGNTRTYHPIQYFPDLDFQLVPKRFDGLVGGWMPCVRKVFPVSDTVYFEVLVFGDVEAHDKFIVQTWHRTAKIENGKMVKAIFGHSYPAFPPARQDPGAEEFYQALLVFAEYWDKQLSDFAPTTLPVSRRVWVDMSRHAFARELMVRPGGVYPKYGAVDRDYYGSEYDGFQDIFTMATYANLEWGRFGQARAIIDNYFADFVDANGVNNMRGPETAQFGMTLSLLARYFNYTGDGALLVKHRDKIEATARLLTDLHDESLRLPRDDPGYGLIHGWSESDSCLMPKPSIWWLPYFANNAYAARGLKDIAEVWPAVRGGKRTAQEEHTAVAAASDRRTAAEWQERSRVLQGTVVAAMRKAVKADQNPPYIGPFPGAEPTFWESMQKERPSPQQWVHRAYAELLQADVLPPDLANLVIDCMRAYGATTVGIVANVEPPHATGRDILGFISYGYAQMLLRLDRIEEYLLFLYSHRYHDHTRGSWTAGEVSGITGDTATFCIPAQQTIPLLVRWMLVLEDSDEDRLYLAKGLPRDWVASGEEIRIQGAPTRWGRVDFRMRSQPAENQVAARVELSRAGAPRELHVKFRMLSSQTLRGAKVNGRPATSSGAHGDTVIIETGREKSFEVVAQFDATS